MDVIKERLPFKPQEHLEMDITNEASHADSESDENKNYLDDLVQQIKPDFESQTLLSFKIVEAKAKGFLVKVGGLFAFVSYHHFAWTYPSDKFMKNVSSSFVGCIFTGRIHTFSENPISILIDAKDHKYHQFNLREGASYRGVVMQKSSFGFFVDLGLHFNWRHGPYVGLIHNNNMADIADYAQWEAGDEIVTNYFGKNHEGKLILGDVFEPGKAWDNRLGHLIGTIQKVTVTVDETGFIEFVVLGKYLGRAPITKVFYPKTKAVAKAYFYGLQDGEEIACEVLSVNNRKKYIALRLPIE